jgi:hypothetical protein
MEGGHRPLSVDCYAIACWAMDAIVETHDRFVGKTWRDAKRLYDARFADSKTALQTTLRGFSNLGAALIEANGDGAPLEDLIIFLGGWDVLEQLVATAAQLTDTMAAEPLAHVSQGFHRFRRYP